MDKISIIVPVHNAKDFLEETIWSVLKQTYSYIELILVDDASDDGSTEICKQYAMASPSTVRFLSSESRIAIGAAETRNRGIKAASGRFICFLDADDLWEPEKLEKQVRFMREKGCAFSFTGYEFTKKDGRKTGKIVRVPEKITYGEALKNTTIFTSTVMFDTFRISKDRLLMPNVKSEDTATWWKILRSEVNAAYGLDEPLVSYRRSGGTLSSNKLKAVSRIWGLYRHNEHLCRVESLRNFFGWGKNAVRRRV